MRKILVALAFVFAGSALASGSSGGIGLMPVIPDGVEIDDNTVGVAEEAMQNIILDGLDEEKKDLPIDIKIGESVLTLAPGAYEFKSRTMTTINNATGAKLLLKPIKADLKKDKKLP